MGLKQRQEVTSRAFTRRVTEAMVRITQRRWCHRGYHWGVAEGGKYYNSGKTKIKMWACAACLKKKRQR
jgi:hypothetical protein